MNREIVFKAVNSMHFTRSVEYFERKKERVTEKLHQAGLDNVLNLLRSQWFNPPFNKWAVFHSPVGYATTNNPCENFNAVVKKLWTNRIRVPLVALMNTLVEASGRYSLVVKPFHEVCHPNTKMMTHFRKSDREGRVEVGQNPRMSMAYLLGGVSTESFITVKSFLPTVMPNDLHSRAKLKMEVLKMPCGGWKIDMESRFCPCMYFFKYGFCVHLFKAMKRQRIVIPGQKFCEGNFVNRRRNRPATGRNPQVGTALSLN
jgi:hypothetical protein